MVLFFFIDLTGNDQVHNDQQAHSSTVPTNNSEENKDNNEDKSKAFLNANSSNASSENIQTDPSNITIKLKYINDDVRIVDGRLEECLGDFKTYVYSKYF